MLVAIDGSARDRAVLETAAETARRFAATIRLVRVLEAGADAMVRGIGKELVALSARVSGITFEPPLVIVGSPPWREIVDAAMRLNVDLIVVGGPQSSTIASSSDRHVLVIRDRMLV